MRGHCNCCLSVEVMVHGSWERSLPHTSITAIPMPVTIGLTQSCDFFADALRQIRKADS